MITGVTVMREDEDGNRTVQISTKPELVRAIERRARAERRSISNCIAAIIASAVGQDRGVAA
jgi:hypothetical protein